LKGKKPMKKNVVAIDNVLCGKLQCFPQLNKIKKPFREIV
jgi:hypothetical protein